VQAGRCSFVRKAYAKGILIDNTRLVKWLFSQLSSEAEFNINRPSVQELPELECFRSRLYSLIARIIELIDFQLLKLKNKPLNFYHLLLN